MRSRSRGGMYASYGGGRAGAVGIAGPGGGFAGGARGAGGGACGVAAGEECTACGVRFGGDFDVMRPRRDFTCIICLPLLLLLIPLLCWLLSGTSTSQPYDCRAGMGIDFGGNLG